MWSTLVDQFAEVLHTFRHHKGRSLLTLLGMIIGAGSVVLLAGLLSGGEEALLSTSQGVTDSDVIRVETAAIPQAQRGRTQRALEQQDQAALGSDQTLALRTAEGVVQAWGQIARARGRKQEVMLFGTTERTRELFRISVQRGRFLDSGDVSGRARVAVVGFNVWQDLLQGVEDLSTMVLMIGGVRYQVVGVLQHKPVLGGGDTRKGNTWDGRVIVPLTTLQSVARGNRRVDKLFLRVAQRSSGLLALLDPARKMTRELLLRRHYGVENFKVDRNQEEAQQEQLVFLVIKVLLLSTAGLSLLVGGINIMNIMLVTVTERTREIGVRRALGATRGDILRQFVLESGLIAACGGLCGVAGGLLLVFLSSKGLAVLTGTWTPYYEPWAVALGMSSAALTGVIFGLYPAWRAAHLEPVEALRRE